jgi:TRAP-type C4-dicarboxylate transport system permease small subunit
MIKLPVIWTEEGARYFFVCMIFIGAVAVFERDQNVQLRILSSKLSERGKKVLYLVNYAIIVVFTVLFLLGSVQMTKIDWRIPPVTISWLRKGYLFLVCVISCVFILIIAVFHMLKRLKEKKVNL